MGNLPIKKTEAKEEKADKAGKKAKTKTEEKADVSPAEKEKLTKEALADILEHVGVPEPPTGTYVPTGWNTKYKPVLGSYKKFCSTQPALQVVEREHGGYTILKAGAKVPAQTAAV